MSAQFTRQTRPTSYIGYTKNPTTKQVPVVVGGQQESMPVYPDVFIREYPAIKIASVDDPRTDSQRRPSLYVKFDASSAKNADGEPLKLREDFGASITAGGEMEKAVRLAHQNGIEVYVAFETKRKYRRMGTDEVISFLTPIQTLRGVGDDGKGKGNANSTRENCSNVLVAVGPTADPNTNVVSDEAVSDPFEWGTFRANYDGTAVPAGYVRAEAPDGSPSGAIVPRPETPAGGTIDAAAVAAQVVALLQGGGGDERPTPRAVRSAEAKPWESYNSDGTVNAGSYLASRSRDTWAGAMSLLETASYAEQDAARSEDRDPRILGQDVLAPAAASLTRVLLCVADQVQHKVTGHTNRADRSHQEAGRWSHKAATYLVPLDLAWIVDDDSAAVKAWAKRLVDTAASLYASAMDDVKEYLEGPRGARHTPVSDASSNAQGAVAAQDRKITSVHPPEAAIGADAGDDTAAADDSQLMQRWNQLLASVKLAGHEQKVAPMLRRTFNTDDLSSVSAERFKTVLPAWEQNPAKFCETARDAFNAATAA